MMNDLRKSHSVCQFMFYNLLGFVLQRLKVPYREKSANMKTIKLTHSFKFLKCLPHTHTHTNTHTHTHTHTTTHTHTHTHTHTEKEREEGLCDFPVKLSMFLTTPSCLKAQVNGVVKRPL